MKNNDYVPEKKLEKAVGGFYNDSDAPQNLEAPIMLASEGDVKRFTDAAALLENDVRVSGTGHNNSVDGKNYEAVLALDRSGFVYARSVATPEFLSIIHSFEVC